MIGRNKEKRRIYDRM